MALTFLPGISLHRSEASWARQTWRATAAVMPSDAGSAYQTVARWSPRRSETCKLSPIVAVVEAVKESRLADAEVLLVSPSGQPAVAPAGG
jgi:hypothetical protein